MDHINDLIEYLEKTGVGYRTDVTGRECTTFKIGGRISVFAEPSTVFEACLVLKYAEDNGIEHFVIGNGSNLLIPDGGMDKLFIRLSGKLTDYGIEGNTLHCGAGASMAAAAKHSVASGFMGLEWAAGIPGTVGGAIAMNAGAYGGEIKHVLRALTVYEDGKLRFVKADPEELGYRRSAYSFPKAVVLEADLALLPDDGGAKARMDDYSARRRDKQPLSYPSAGSTFKRPEGHYAGALIEQAGLKGYSVGGASVSRKHAGFVINEGGATYEDVLGVIKHVKEVVYERSGVVLEPEVKILK